MTKEQQDSDIEETDVKDDVVKPETIALNLKLYSLFQTKREWQEFEEIMQRLVAKFELEHDKELNEAYLKNVTLRNSFGGVRHSLDLNVPFLTNTTDPLNLTMNVRDFVTMLKRSKYIVEAEDEDLLIDILERYMDQKA